MDRYKKRAVEAGQQAIKTKSMYAMRLRKLYLGKIETTQPILLKLEESRETVLSAIDNRETVNALQSASRALKDLRMDNVDSVIDDLEESLEDVQITQETLASSHLGDAIFDEDDLLRELNGLLDAEPQSDTVTTTSDNKGETETVEPLKKVVEKPSLTIAEPVQSS